MARDFTKNTSNRLEIGANVVSPILHGASVISAHVWMHADTLGVEATGNRAFTIILETGGTTGFLIAVRGDVAPKVLRVGGRSRAADAFQARDATSEFTTGVWHSCGGVLDIGGDTITPYFNGVAEGAGAVTFGNATYTNSTPTGADIIGAGQSVTTGNQLDGALAELCFWLAAVNADEFRALSRGVSPWKIRNGPDLWYPLWGLHSPEIELIRNKTATIVGSIPQRNHAPVVPFSSRYWRGTVPLIGEAAGGGSALLKRLHTEGLFTGRAAA